MTRPALALALLAALLLGCADGSGGARLMRTRYLAVGRIDHYRMASGEVRRLYVPDAEHFDWRGPRWLEAWEMSE